MLIEPRILQGFRDFLPTSMVPRERLIETARTVYRSYGFQPIDTPALEFFDVLQGKGGEEADRQIYHFHDSGGRHVGLRFDLTVPLARFAAQHMQQLGTPFKRYQIATVWRGERPQRGRYREFMQCDFDTLGTLSVVADIETILVIHDLMMSLGLEQFTIRVNHRQILNGLLEGLGCLDRATAILRCLDKLPKVGPETVRGELAGPLALPAAAADAILRLATLRGSTDELLAELGALVASSEPGREGVARLEEVVRGATAGGVARERLVIDASIARGLDYYTGIIVETFLQELPGMGSVCSGGRYDHLAQLYTSQSIPGIGASLGLDRLLAALEELGRIDGRPVAEVFLAFFAAEQLERYLQMAAALRAEGLRVELYPEARKLGQQLKYASQRGFRVALIAGEDELARGTCQVKDLRRRTSEEVRWDDGVQQLARTVRQRLADGD